MVLVTIVSLFIVFAVLTAAPITWLLMLFLGNFGLNVSFWGALPGGVALGIIGGKNSTSVTKSK